MAKRPRKIEAFLRRREGRVTFAHSGAVKPSGAIALLRGWPSCRCGVCADDFSRHNPIHRWWGGTELTNDRLWRWDPENRIVIAP